MEYICFYSLLILATSLDINCTFQQVENISSASNAWIVDAVAAPSEFGFNDIHRPLRWPQSGIWHSDLQEKIHIAGVGCTTIQQDQEDPAWKLG